MKPSLQSLVDVLSRAADQAKAEIANARRDERAEWAYITVTTTSPVANALRAVPEILDLEAFVYRIPYEISVIDLNSVAIYLTYRAQFIDPNIMVLDLFRLAKERRIQFKDVRLLSDIQPTDTIDLGHGFSVVPASAIPRTELTPALLSEQNRQAHGWGTHPTAALVCSREISLNLSPRPKHGDLPIPVQEDLAPRSDWTAAMNALIVGSDGAPQFLQGFSVISDVGWFGAPATSLRITETFPVRGKMTTNVDADRLAHLFETLRKPNPTIDLAVRQLESSRRRPSNEERAIDLGICVEILLMSGAKDNGEISYKIGTRAAWLLGKSPEERITVFDAARRLYNTRSSAAHTGIVKAARDMDEMKAQRAQFEASDSLCARLISKLAEQGIPKDWKLVVLNSASS